MIVLFLNISNPAPTNRYLITLLLELLLGVIGGKLYCSELLRQPNSFTYELNNVPIAQADQHTHLGITKHKISHGLTTLVKFARQPLVNFAFLDIS